MRISVEINHDKKDEETMVREWWGFDLIGLDLVFVAYNRTSRRKRHSLNTCEGNWEKRSCSGGVQSPPPPLPRHIKELAKQELFDKIKVRTWEEWENKQ